MKTFSAKPSDITRDWYVVDANEKVLGRLAADIAHRLRGKHKAIYTPHMDTGDYIVVTNVDKIRVTGNKGDDKLTAAIRAAFPRPRSARCRTASRAAHSQRPSRACCPRGRLATRC
jgi:ribosomal protein L13